MGVPTQLELALEQWGQSGTQIKQFLALCQESGACLKRAAYSFPI